jgi:FkbM family methyltransferase
MDTSEIETALHALLAESPRDAERRSRAAFDELASPLQERLVLFGTGRLGQRTVTGLRALGLAPVALSDNDPNLWGRSVGGIPILPPAEAASLHGDTSTFVVCIWGAHGTHRIPQIEAQLRQLGCRKVVPFAHLFWRHPEVFLPHYAVDRPSLLLEEAKDVARAFSLMADLPSRAEFLAQVRWRLLMDFGGLPVASPGVSYFPDDLLSDRADEHFVDCGAYDGDTIRDFLVRRDGRFRRVTALEPDPSSFSRLERFVASLDEHVRARITALPLAAYSKSGTLRFLAEGLPSSAASAAGGADLVEVACTSLDELLADAPVTFIKMDIEGGETAALEGASGVIARDRPVLAVCAYHRQDHLWRVPLLIDGLADGYSFFLRAHGNEGWDLVCYAIPPSRMRR